MHPVADQIAGLDEPARSLFARFYARALELVPTAVEGLSYGMPALLHRDRPLVALAVTANGYSVYPFSGQIIATLAAQFGELPRTKGTVSFTDAHPLPPAAFDALVLARRAEIDAALDG